jgi:phage terminase large subunit-like protein
LLLNHLCGPSARDRRLYSSGQSRDQAALTFDQARKMVLFNADLRQIISIKESGKILRYDELGIEHRALSAEAHTAQGLNPTLHICDELGQCVGPFEALELATAAQRDPLTVVISTQSASDADLLSTLIDDGLSGHDPRSTCSLYAAPKDCALDDEDAISAANPSYRLFMNHDEILAAARAALRMPAREAAFRRYTLNQRIEQADPFVSPGLWESCRGQVAPLDELPVLYAGLDLSAVNDLSAFVLVGKKKRQLAQPLPLLASAGRSWRQGRGRSCALRCLGVGKDTGAPRPAVPSTTISSPMSCATCFANTIFSASRMTLGILISSNRHCYAPGSLKALLRSASKNSLRQRR